MPSPDTITKSDFISSCLSSVKKDLTPEQASDLFPKAIEAVKGIEEKLGVTDVAKLNSENVAAYVRMKIKSYDGEDEKIEKKGILMEKLENMVGEIYDVIGGGGGGEQEEKEEQLGIGKQDSGLSREVYEERRASLVGTSESLYTWDELNESDMLSRLEKPIFLGLVGLQGKKVLEMRQEREAKIERRKSQELARAERRRKSVE